MKKVSDHIFRGKKTNPIGGSTKNLSANVPKELYEQINSLAEKSGMNQGEYIKCVMFYAAALNLIIPNSAKAYGNNSVIRNEIETGFSSFEARKLSVGEVAVALGQLAAARLSQKPQVDAPSGKTDLQARTDQKGKDDPR